MTLDSSINLQPGEVYFSSPLKKQIATRLKTILGSCVAVIIWHQKSKTAGMCHYLLTEEADSTKATQVMQKYRYGDEALDYLLKKMAILHPLDQYEISIFGGSNMYPSLTKPTIGEVNVRFAKNWAKKNNLVFCQQDTLGNNGRSLTLDLTTGSIKIVTYNERKGVFSEH